MTDKGRILFINRVFPPDSGASGLRLMELCQGLAERGWSITVLTNKGRGTAPANLHPNITLKRLPFGSVDKKPTALQYYFWLKCFSIAGLFMPRTDIVMTLTDPPMSVMVSAWLKLVRRIKAVHWVHDLYPHLFPVMGVRLSILQPILQKLSNIALKMHDRIVVLGDDTASLLRAEGIPDSKLAVIPNWPDVLAAHIDKTKPTRHSSQNPFILEGVFTVLYSGNFGLVHDFDDLIEAIKIVHQSPHPIRFIFAGDGRKFTQVRDKIESMMLTNVHFIRAQPRDKFMDMLQAGDLHVATMIPESTGLVAPSKINSSLGLGRPCLLIGSKKSFQAQLIEKYKAGAVIDPTDPHAKFQLAEAIIEYATTPSLYEQAKENSLKAAESISFDKACDAFDAVCTDVLKKRA